MISFQELPFFMIAALILAISSDPDMIYLISITCNSQKNSLQQVFSPMFSTPKLLFSIYHFFPQFIKPGYGWVLTQSLELGIIQVILSFSINFLIILTASKAALFFSNNPFRRKIQKWFMASALTYLAIKMAFSKDK